MPTSGAGEQPRVRSRHQSRLLALLRDEGPLSRVALGERLDLPRAKLAGELSRLIDTGLVEIGGPAAGRGGGPPAPGRPAPRPRVLPGRGGAPPPPRRAPPRA